MGKPLVPDNEKVLLDMLSDTMHHFCDAFKYQDPEFEFDFGDFVTGIYADPVMTHSLMMRFVHHTMAVSLRERRLAEIRCALTSANSRNPSSLSLSSSSSISTPPSSQLTNPSSEGSMIVHYHSRSNSLSTSRADSSASSRAGARDHDSGHLQRSSISSNPPPFLFQSASSMRQPPAPGAYPGRPSYRTARSQQHISSHTIPSAGEIISRIPEEDSSDAQIIDFATYGTQAVIFDSPQDIDARDSGYETTSSLSSWFNGLPSEEGLFPEITQFNGRVLPGGNYADQDLQSEAESTSFLLELGSFLAEIPSSQRSQTPTIDQNLHPTHQLPMDINDGQQPYLPNLVTRNRQFDSARRELSLFNRLSDIAYSQRLRYAHQRAQQQGLERNAPSRAEAYLVTNGLREDHGDSGPPALFTRWAASAGRNDQVDEDSFLDIGFSGSPSLIEGIPLDLLIERGNITNILDPDTSFLIPENQNAQPQNVHAGASPSFFSRSESSSIVSGPTHNVLH